MILKEDTRPFWKSLLEAMVIGVSLGVLWGVATVIFGASSERKPPTYIEYIILIAVIFCWPKKWRFIR